MARRQSAGQAKALRQKKIAAALGVVLAGVLGIQMPKLLHELHGSAPALPPPAASTAAAPSASAAPIAGPAAGAALTGFGRLAAKDPFHALVAAAATPASRK